MNVFSNSQNKFLRRKLQFSSDSSDDSDSSIELSFNRRKKIRPMSDSEDSDDSECNLAAKIKHSIPLVSSDLDSENESCLSDTSSYVNNYQDKSIQCPICLESIRKKQIGIPTSCFHVFCLDCISEWSKTTNTCPIDRQEYNKIKVYKEINGKIIRKIEVKTPEINNESINFNDLIICEICQLGNRENELLLCDGCDLGFHLDCLEPPLLEVPEGAWYCKICIDNDAF